MIEATQLGSCCFDGREQQDSDPTSFSVAARYAAPEPTWTMLTIAPDPFSRSVVCMTADAVPSSSTLIGSQSQGVSVKRTLTGQAYPVRQPWTAHGKADDLIAGRENGRCFHLAKAECRMRLGQRSR